MSYFHCKFSLFYLKYFDFLFQMCFLNFLVSVGVYFGIFEIYLIFQNIRFYVDKRKEQISYPIELFL